MILRATVLGEGPPVVLLHGLFGRSQTLGMLARRLAARCRVISLDARNHGGSPHAPGMAYAALAGDVVETLDAVGVTRAGFLGHSMGGKTAMAVALSRPECVSRLLVVDIAPVAYTHKNADVAAALQALPLTPGLTRRDADAALAASVPDAAVRGFLLLNLDFSGQPSWRIGLDEIAAGIADLEGWACEGVFAGPTLFVAGANSDYLTEDYHAQILALFPKARFVTVDDAGHWVHADQPEAFAAIAEAFLLD